MRRQIPANRNPFTYYKRVDHLDRHAQERRPLPPPPRRHPLGRRRHRRVPQPRQPRHAQQPARPRTGPPHRGPDPHERHPAQRRPERFAELIRLLDPTAIADPTQHPPEGHRASLRAPPQGPKRSHPRSVPMWADRTGAASDPVSCRRRWRRRCSPSSPTPGPTRSPAAPPVTGGQEPFPWTLFSGSSATLRSRPNLSSHRAQAHRHASAGAAARASDATQRAEDAALETLLERSRAARADTSSKLDALVDQLREIGVGPSSTAASSSSPSGSPRSTGLQPRSRSARADVRPASACCTAGLPM